jgi:lysophospholipase L1-like esterase
MKTQTTSPRLLASALIIGAFSLGPVCSPAVMAQSAVSALAPLPANADSAPEMNAFLKADQKQMPPTGAVLFMGSSSIRLWTTLAQDIPEIPVINRGFGGSQIFENTLYVDRIAVPYHPKIIVLFAGTNDLAYGNKTAPQVFQEYKDFVAKVHSALPDTRIVYIAISPTVARWKNEMQVMEANYLIARWTHETNSPTEKLDFIDTHDPLLSADGQPQPALERADGLHLNAKGYAVWTSVIKPRVLALAAMDGVQRLDMPPTAKP